MREEGTNPLMVIRDVSLTHRHRIPRKSRMKHLKKRNKWTHDNSYSKLQLELWESENEDQDSSKSIEYLYNDAEKAEDNHFNKLIARIPSQKILNNTNNTNERGRISLLQKVGNSNSYKSLRPTLYNDGNTDFLMDPGTMKSIWDSPQ